MKKCHIFVLVLIKMVLRTMVLEKNRAAVPLAQKKSVTVIVIIILLCGQRVQFNFRLMQWIQDAPNLTLQKMMV